MSDRDAQARALHERVPVIDTHSHFLINGHYLRKRFGRRHKPPWLWNPLRNAVDMPRLREGGVSCSTFTVYVPIPPLRWTAWAACRRILDTLDALVARHSDEVVKTDTARAIRSAHRQHKLAALPAVEGGHVIGARLERLAELRERGVRLLTITHFVANRIADAHVGPRVHRGLSGFGREVIATCERLGIIVDLAHATERAFYQALETAARPPVVTHTGLREKGRSERFHSEEQLRALAAAGGMAGVLMCPWYQKRWSLLGSVEQAAEVYARMADIVGPDHLIIGTDMDGYVWLPRGMRDVSELPRLTAALLERGFTEEETAGILGENFLRLLEQWGE